jgi:hypothetical protein
MDRRHHSWQASGWLRWPRNIRKSSKVRRRLPDFIERGNNFLEVASRVGDRLAEAAENGSQNWYESLLSR